MQQKIVYLSVDKLNPHPNNPRKELGDLTELAESIKVKGVLQNLTVVPYFSPVHNRTIEGLYTIVIGHRRHAASQLAGLTELPCVITEMTLQEQIDTMAIENLQRSDLTPYEEAECFQMMLDLGRTVETVAQDTGFSETTIRRRVKLLDLDKKKFQKAEQRGGTMQDYLKLTDIQDPVNRNKVLDKVGTPDFNNALQIAKDKEAAKAIMEDLIAKMKDADWCQEIDADSVTDHGSYTLVRRINRWSRDVSRPDDADTAEYFYHILAGGFDISLYKKAANTDEKKRLAEKKRRVEEELDQIWNELRNVARLHQEVRENFIMAFTAFNSSEMDIASFAAKAMLYGSDYGAEIDQDRLGNLIGVDVSSQGEMEQTAWNRELFYRPQRVLLCAAYTMLEGDGETYATRMTNREADLRVPEPKAKNLCLDLIYHGLVSLGYEMSEEEKQMKNGSHPLYTRAKFLVDDYLREKEALQNA